MHNPRYPLRINVGFLTNTPVGTNRDIHFEFADLKLSPDLHLNKIQGVARLNRTPQGVLIEAEFLAHLPAECVRCLEPFELELHTRYQELFSFHTHPTVESALVIPEDGNIDLAPLTRDYLLVEVPIKEICKPECKGLCPVCGEDLNVHACVHQNEAVTL